MTKIITPVMFFLFFYFCLCLQCTTLSLLHYTILSLAHYTTLPLVHCTTLPLVHCSALPVVHCTTLSLFHCATLSLIHCTTLSVVYCTTFAVVHCTTCKFSQFQIVKVLCLKGAGCSTITKGNTKVILWQQFIIKFACTLLRSPSSSAMHSTACWNFYFSSLL